MPTTHAGAAKPPVEPAEEARVTGTILVKEQETARAFQELKSGTCPSSQMHKGMCKGCQDGKDGHYPKGILAKLEGILRELKKVAAVL